MEWLVDFVLTRCNFWRGASRSREEGGRFRNADGYVSGMCERATEGGRAPYEEYPSREHVIYLPGDRRPGERPTRAAHRAETRNRSGQRRREREKERAASVAEISIADVSAGTGDKPPRNRYRR